MSSESESEAANDLQLSDSDNEQVSSSSLQSSDHEENISSRLRSRVSKTAETNSCKKVMLPDHLAAYLEERELDRDVEPVQCSADIIEKIFGNYLIVKNILSHLQWQQKLICKEVCPLWNNVVSRLQVEQLCPVDFSINAAFQTMNEGVVLLKSSEFYSEPMAVFTFCTAMGYQMSSCACQHITPNPCLSPCDHEHSSKLPKVHKKHLKYVSTENTILVIDFIYQVTAAPRDCMFTIKASNMLYMPLPYSVTVENTIKNPMAGVDAAFHGMYIPKMPGVEFKIYNINCSNGIQQDLLPEIKELTENYIVKGVVACLTEDYLLYVNESNAECLAFLNAVQPDTPFAFGGCLVEDTSTKVQDLVGIVESVNKNKEFVSGNIMSLGLFVTPKQTSTTVQARHNFEAYSFVLESSDWSKLKISQCIQKFSECVPRFEHSIAFKFSCMGRQNKHEAEEQNFRLHFPHTRLAGCFGNGELGVNHPSIIHSKSKHPAKRTRYLAYEKVHSYSTVFLYIGWGKIIEEAERDD